MAYLPAAQTYLLAMLDTLDAFFFGNGPIAAVQDLFGVGHPEAFRWIGLLGDTWGIMLVLGVALWLYGRDTAYALLGAVVLGAVTKAIMSAAFGVPRPSGDDIVVYEELSIGSFPSGHVYQILIPWGVLWARERLPFLVPAIIVLAVGLSRLYLGVHYLGDVVFAILFGVVFVWAYVRLFPRVEGWFHRRSVRFYAVLTALAAAGVIGSLFVLANTARRWEIIGLVLAAGLGLILERKRVSYVPPAPRPSRAAALGIGLAGLLALAWPVLHLPDAWKAPALALAFLLMLWTVLLAPALIQRTVRAGAVEPSAAHDR